jgi:hypothetical protein
MSSTATYHGGPAFPQKEPLTSDHHGMTLRDYFAAKAMAAFISEPVQGVEQPLFHDLGNGTSIDIAVSSYEMADAMLKARNA